MPNISQKARIIPASPIRKLVPYADKAKSKGIRVYHLNIGQPDIESPSAAIEAIRNIDVHTIEYTHSAGIESYRDALSEFYSSRGREVKSDEIIITTGGSEAVLFGLIATCNPDDEIIIPEPFYANYISFAIEAGVKIVAITSYIESGFALPSIEEFEKLITPRTKAIMICNPNNPTGYLYTKQEIADLKQLAQKYNLFLLSDEVYSDFCYDGKTHHSLLTIEGIDENVIVFDSVSKRYSMCGSRIGALISRNAQVLDAVLRMGQARLCPPYIDQVAAEAATRATPQSYFDTVQKEYIARRDLMVSRLNEIEGVICPTPNGAFYVMAALPVDSSENFARWLLEDFSHEKSTIMIAPADGFYSNSHGASKNQVRLAYVLNIEELDHAMTLLKIALDQYPGKTI